MAHSYHGKRNTDSRQNKKEGDIGVCGIAVLDNFSCGISVILILNCGIAVFSKSAGCGILDGIKFNSPSSPPTFSELFPVSDSFISC